VRLTRHWGAWEREIEATRGNQPYVDPRLVFCPLRAGTRSEARTRALRKEVEMYIGIGTLLIIIILLILLL
jgi:hypothetical protein